MARASLSIFPSPGLHANSFNRVPENEAACNLNNPGRGLHPDDTLRDNAGLRL